MYPADKDRLERIFIDFLAEKVVHNKESRITNIIYIIYV